jgi:GNAT superfamily N-acetyltransferase
MNLEQIRDLYDIQQRRDINYSGMIREETEHVVRHISQIDTYSTVIYTHGLTSDNLASVIDGEIAYFQNIGHDFEWKLYTHDSPPDLRDQLAARGFEIEEVEALVALDLQTAPESLFQPTSNVRRVTHPDRIQDIVYIMRTVWQEDMDDIGVMLRDELANNPDYTSIYIAYADDTPASAAWVRFAENNPFASLWGGATLEEHRGKGLYTSLVAVRAQEARQRGVRYLTVEASAMSRPILEKRGFQFISWTYPCMWYFSE